MRQYTHDLCEPANSDISSLSTKGQSCEQLQLRTLSLLPEKCQPVQNRKSLRHLALQHFTSCNRITLLLNQVFFRFSQFALLALNILGISGDKKPVPALTAVSPNSPETRSLAPSFSVSSIFYGVGILLML